MQRLRSILLIALLAMYGASSLLGPALHSLPGLAHAVSASEPSSQQVERGRLDGGKVCSADQCPVCHFLAQGQLPSELSAVLWAVRANPQVALEDQTFRLPERYQPKNPRAPPPSSAHIS
jgi:hypothetical protein